MSTVRDILNDLKGMSVADLQGMAVSAAIDILPQLQQMYGADGSNFFLNIILCAIAVDGSVSTREVEVVRPILEAAAGRSTSMQEVVDIINRGGHGYSSNLKLAAECVNNINNVNSGLHTAICTLCCTIIAANGEIDPAEEAWLNKLLFA